jgi:2-phosphosulfolactate phosphatase
MWIMKIDVNLVPTSTEVWGYKNKTIVVIDVLRASSTIITALEFGARNIVPVLSPDEAVGLKTRYDSEDVLLGGERGGLKIQGFDLGNSPLEYTNDVVNGKTIVFTTTNGTKAIRSANGAETLLISAYINLAATAKKVVELGNDTLIICAGRQGSFSLEDAACAGTLCATIGRLISIEETDSAKATRMIAASYASPLDVFTASEHGQHLLSLGFKEDLEYAANVNSCDTVPFFIGGHLVLER